MYNRLDTIPVCDRQTDGRTDGHLACDGIVRAMHTRRAVKSRKLVESVSQTARTCRKPDRKPGRKPGLQLARIMECGLNGASSAPLQGQRY